MHMNTLISLGRNVSVLSPERKRSKPCKQTETKRERGGEGERRRGGEEERRKARENEYQELEPCLSPQLT